MDLFALSLAIVSGICLATGTFYLFMGLRRKDDRQPILLFSLFALSYAAVILTAIANYGATSIEEWMSSARWDGVFVVLTWSFLIGYVALYTGVKPRIFLGLLVAAFVSTGIANVLRMNLIYDEILGLASVTLPWGEQLAYVEATDSVWVLVFLVANLVTIGYVLIACTLQFRRGERRSALVLGAGMAWFIMTIIIDILVDLGIAPLYLGDFGFLGLAIVLSLQLSNEALRTEEELAHYRQSLEALVKERTGELRQRTRMARVLLNAPPDSALLIDPQGTILDINEVAAARLGTTVAEARGASIYDRLEPGVAQLRAAKVAALMATEEAVRWEDVRSGRIIDNSLFPILDDEGQVVNIAIFAADITERRQVEQTLRRHREEVAVDQERSRIARDLHDSVTQTIYSASLIAEALPRLWERDPEQVPGRLSSLVQLIRGALAEMRTLLFELRPAALEEAGLGRLLHQQADLLTGRTQTPVEVTVHGEEDLPAEVKIALYRIAQEAFNNLVKHAGATQVAATLRFQPEGVELTIEDNGRGFDFASVPDDRMGLKIMRERAGAIGATLGISSRVGAGTKVMVRWRGGEGTSS